MLDHAQAMTPFATPTINGIRRFRPYSFAPDRVAWAVENRGALVRVQGGPGDSGTHLENRLGEPAANPYLYLAADIAAGLDGIERDLTPPEPIRGNPYESDAPSLPTTLGEALDALDADAMYRKQFGDGFVDYLLMMKREELTRAQDETAGETGAGDDDPDAAARDWEMKEYFEFY